MQGRYPSNWQETTIGKIARVRRGASPRPIDSPVWFADEGPGWIRIVDVTRSDGRLRSTEQRLSPQGAMRSVPVHPGQLIMSICATIGEPVVLDMEACIHDGFVVFDHYEELVDTQFFYHFLRFMTPGFRSVGQTGTQANLNTDIVNRTRILLPPLPQQHRIAEILDTIDEAIQKTEALIAKLKAMKQGLLHDLLTRGLDENGKLRDPKAHPEQFKDSSFGLIPRAWDVKALDEIAVKIQDGTHFSPQSSKGPYRYLTSKNVRFGYIDLNECCYISKKEHDAIYSRCDVKYGDILLTKDGANTGNGAINIIKEQFSLLSSVAFIRVDDTKHHAGFVLQYLLSPIGQRRIKDIMSGLAITRLTLEKIKAFVIPFPKFQEQTVIANYLTNFDARIRAEEQYLEKLRLQKKGLMHDLLTGKVRAKA